MKLALSSQEGISVLTGTGDISPHDLEVLRAGVKKLFHSGRNRIVLELLDTLELPPDVIREISKFDLFARELSGRVILAGKNAQLKEQVLKFAAPPIIECFEGREAALKYFKAEPAATAPASATASAPEDQQKAYKADIRQKELTDLTSLRKRLAELENENRVLVQQLHSAWMTSHLHGDAAHQAEIQSLTEKLEEAFNQIKASE